MDGDVTRSGCMSQIATFVWLLGVGFILFLLLIVFVTSLSLHGKGHSDETCSPIDYFSTIKANEDFLGKPRSIQTSKGAVAADHSRCSEEGVNILEVGISRNAAYLFFL